MLIGRDGECEQLLQLLHDGRNGRGRMLVITGDAGVGKSTLLEFARSHSEGALILSAVGAETESEIPYVNLSDVFRPVIDEIAQLPPRQAEALSGALALGPDRAGDRFGVAAATLSLFGVLADARPVVVIIDDAQWIDYFSSEALAFAAKRLKGSAITFLVSMRSETATSSPFRREQTLALSGLDTSSARELLRQTGRRLGPAATARLISEAGGNPLALRELPSLLSPEDLAVWSRGLEPLPIDSVLQEAFSDRARDLPAETQDVLLLIATLGSVPFEVVERAMHAQGVSKAALEDAEQAGLMVEEGGRWQLRHPLLRAAVYQAASPSRRRRTHLLAAAVLERVEVPNALERRSWHLVSAGGTADDALARTLETASTEELSRANFAVASKLLERSASLTATRADVAPRLLRAADSARLAGAIDDAQRLLVRALELAADRELTVAIEYYLSRIEVWRGTAIAGRNRLVDLANVVQPVDGVMAARMLSDAALASIEIGEVAQAAEMSERALGLLAANGTTSLETAMVRALVLGARGEVAEARALLTQHARQLDEVDALAFSATSPNRSSANDQLGLVAALAHLAVEEPDRAEALLERAVGHARDESAIGVLPFRLGRLAWVQVWQGRWAAARASATEALQLADDTGWVAERPSSLSALARVEAAIGLDADCRAHVAQAEEAADRRGVRPYYESARAALGLLELTRGNGRAALLHLEQVADFTEGTGLADTPLMWWSGDLIEAYVSQERFADAYRVLSRLETGLNASARPVAAAVVARSRALLESEDFERHMAEALRWHAQSSMPFERARTELRLGSHLRRHQHRVQARAYLDSALATFGRLGAAPWRERTLAELEATGVHLGERSTELGRLTPQEFQVAQYVARGLSNREVATAMFLSVKTIEYHLGNTFHKLGIRRRSQLTMLVAQQDPGTGDLARAKASS